MFKFLLQRRSIWSFKINNEIFTYTGLTTNTFTGVVRGFSGISSYRTDLNQEELLLKKLVRRT